MSPEWHNHAGTQSCTPRSIETPATLEELVALVRRARGEGTTVRAVGAGHAWSDIALTDGLLVEPARLGGPLLPLDSLRDGVAGDGLVRVLAGTHLRQLNDELWAAGLGLKNMGGYDAQTLAGVVSTSTHGSGLRFGPFPDVVRSLDLVDGEGDVVRVEPRDGISDPARYDGRLIQDDDTFAAAICGLGTLGLLHSLVIEVRERFYLQERRTLSTWEEERGRLGPGGVLDHEEHYELFINPYAQSGGTHRALVTCRTPTEKPGADLPIEDRRRHPLTELEARLPLTGALLRFAARHYPRLLTWGFDGTLEGMKDLYSDVSYKVFNIGEANKLPAISAELGIPLADGAHVRAVDRLLEIAARERKRGRFHTSPFSLRFVAGSRAFASMMYGGDTMMIELILVTGTKHGFELLQTYERELAEFGARPHWGQYNVLTPERVRELYPRWDAWLAVERELNASGVFDSEFTRRVGI